MSAPDATFEPIATLSTTGPDAVLDTTSPSDLYLDARSDGDRYLFGDGHRLVELDPDGQVRPLADDIVNASAP